MNQHKKELTDVAHNFAFTTDYVSTAAEICFLLASEHEVDCDPDDFTIAVTQSATEFIKLWYPSEWFRTYPLHPFPGAQIPLPDGSTQKHDFILQRSSPGSNLYIIHPMYDDSFDDDYFAARVIAETGLIYDDMD